VPANQRRPTESQIDQYELGVAFAAAHLAGLRRQADRRRWPAASPGQHHHEPWVFDAGYFRACARQAGLLDHYQRVQQEEAALQETHGWARAACRRASVALWSSGAAIVLPVVALLTG
jgi:hypothetical protein